MKGSSCAGAIWLLGLLLSSLGVLAGCSLETTGSGDLSLSAADDDEDGSRPDVTGDDDDPGTNSGDVDGGPSPAGDGGDDDSGGDAEARGDKCRPGNFEGHYVCKQPPVTSPPWAAGFGGNEISGSFTFRLTATSKPDDFELTGGTLHNEQVAFFKVDATITGTLTCGRPLKGELSNATYTNFIGTVTPFESPFDATFDETTGSFRDGTWLVSDDSGTLCDGTWTATRTD
jgi:hypothetical protein